MGAIRKALADTIKAAGRTPEESARLARRQRLEEVKAALTPAAPPPAPEPASSLLSTAAMLRAEIGLQPATGPTALNGDRILTEAAQKMSAPGSRQDRTADELKRLLGQQPPSP